MRLALYWAPLLAFMAAIFVVSSLPGSTVSGPVTSAPGPSSLSFKLAFAHVVEFGVLAMLAYRLFRAYDLRPVVYLWTATLALTIGYAATDELHQALVPGHLTVDSTGLCRASSSASFPGMGLSSGMGIE